MALLDTEELVAVLMHLFADLFAGFQRHQHQLQVLPSIEDTAEILILDSPRLDIVDIDFHNSAPCLAAPWKMTNRAWQNLFLRAPRPAAIAPPAPLPSMRPEGRRVGKEGISTCPS